MQSCSLRERARGPPAAPDNVRVSSGRWGDLDAGFSLGTPFADVTVLYYTRHSSYTVHDAAAGEREPVLRCSGDPRDQHGLSEDGICWWRQPTASQHPPPPPSNFPSESHEADREAPSPDPGGRGGPCLSAHCHAPLKDDSACTNMLPFHVGEN